MKGGVRVGKRLCKGAKERVIVPTIDTNPPPTLAQNMCTTEAQMRYLTALDRIEEKVLSGTMGQEAAPPPSTEGALFFSDTGEPEVRRLDPAMLAEMGLPPPPRKYVGAWCCPFASPNNKYACTPLSVKEGGHALSVRVCNPFRGKTQKAAMARHLAIAHKSGKGATKRSLCGPLKEYAKLNAKLGFAFVE